MSALDLSSEAKETYPYLGHHRVTLNIFVALLAIVPSHRVEAKDHEVVIELGLYSYHLFLLEQDCESDACLDALWGIHHHARFDMNLRAVVHDLYGAEG